MVSDELSKLITHHSSLVIRCFFGVMRNLLLFFVKYNAFFVFVLLEIISFYLIVNFNKKQGDIYISSANSISGTFYERYDKIKRFWYLNDYNIQLAEDNKRLMEQLENAYYDGEVDTLFVKDSLYTQQYSYIPAVVVNNSVNRHNNYITLNRGSKHGIEKNTGVISSGGLVGIVLKTSKNYSAVMSLLHRNTRISATIKGNDYFGSLVWKDNNPRQMTLEDVPKHIDVHKGDTIVTTSYSHMFPQGLMIGTIDTVRSDGGSYSYSIDVNLSSDLNKIKYVYVVKDLMKEEKLKLEESVKDE